MKRTTIVPIALALAAGSLVATPSEAQTPVRWGADTSVARLVAAARLGSERYRERGNAMADGFRRIGMDFPGMGEHWVHTGRLVAGLLDPKTPTILSYISVGGQPILVGVAYALPLRPRESVPEFPAGAWHEHGGTVEDASFLPVHGGTSPTSGRIRIAVLHVWVWLDNPGGVFETENLRLPFVRAGIAMPAEVPVDAARAVALGFGGESYYRAAVARLAPDSGIGSSRSDAVLAAAADRARQLVGTSGAGQVPILSLVTLWNETWNQIASTVGPAARVAGTFGFGHQP